MSKYTDKNGLFLRGRLHPTNPSRQGMSRLVAAGGIYVPSANINPQERRLSQICVDAQFPPGEEFKWSPGREDWMQDGLVGRARETFFAEIAKG